MTLPFDPSGTPKIYDFGEAVRFVTEWTGLPSEVVDRALEAKERYLMLAGIMVVEEDEALREERVRFGHLLPKEPRILDEGFTAYVAQITGLDEDTLTEIEAAEIAYEDSLGILDRGEDAEDEDRPVFEGHGDHWGSVVPDPAAFIEAHLAVPPSIAHLRFLAQARFAELPEVAVHAMPQNPSLETWGMDGIDEQGHPNLITAFPVVLDAKAHPLELRWARVWSNGCEALVLASTSFGAEVTFFDATFLHPHHEWAPGEVCEVELVAFAFALEPAPDEVFEITKESTIRTLRARNFGGDPKQVTDLSPIEVHTGGMACFFPRKLPCPKATDRAPGTTCGAPCGSRGGGRD